MSRQPQMISLEDAEKMILRIKKMGRSVDKFLQPYNVKSMFELTADQAVNANTLLTNAEEKVNGKRDEASEPSGEGGQVQESRPEEVLNKLRQDIQ